MPTTCNQETIDDFLSERLSPAARHAFEQHLDTCDTCCAELEERAATNRLWDDARLYLSSTDLTLENGQPQNDTGGFDLQNLNFLAPTDDPHMLGRFAGYEICGVVGCGGMGIVLKGFDAALNRYSAIKVLAPHYASSGAARQRFAREAQAAAAVVHDNVIAIHGVDEFNGLPYLVMPYVKGESLQRRIEREGTLPVPETLRISMQIARGLAAAHDQGLVHRDIKPGNILLPENVERVVITDFGLARAADDASLTRSGVIAGTPQYMSPEQARGEGIDHRSDLFSLGSVMYAMCTGHAPFRAETPYGILRRITDNDARPIRETNAQIPLWLCDIVDQLLSKQAASRPATASEVSSLLEDCLAHVQQPNKVPLPDSVKRHRRRLRMTRHLLWLIPVWALLIGLWQWSKSEPVSYFDPSLMPMNAQSENVTAVDGNAPVQFSAMGGSFDEMMSEPVAPREHIESVKPPLELTDHDLAWRKFDDEIESLAASLSAIEAEMESMPAEDTGTGGPESETNSDMNSETPQD